jgi:hypothetical protein
VGVGIASPAVAFHVQGAATTVAAVESLTAASGLAVSQVKVAGNITGSLTGTGASYVESANVTVKTDSITLTGNRPGGISISAADAAGTVRLYSGGTVAANLRATVSAAGAWTVPKAGVLATVAGAATATFSITGLAGDTYGYKLTMHIINATASDCVLRLRPNGASTNLNSIVTTQNEAATSASAVDTTWWLCNMRASSEAFIVVDVRAKTGHRRRASWHATSSKNADQLAVQLVGSGGWNETATELTSFDVVSDVATSIAIGSTIRAEAVAFLLG